MIMAATIKMHDIMKSHKKQSHALLTAAQVHLTPAGESLGFPLHKMACGSQSHGGRSVEDEVLFSLQDLAPQLSS
jgi:hypothetical protein